MTVVAIVGCGFIGRVYAEVLSELGAPVAAVVDPDEGARTHLAQRLGARAYASLEEMLGSEPNVEAVGISSPSQFHLPLALRAFEAGKHVLCEKPLALDLEGAETMVRTAGRAGLKLAIGLKMRFEPIFSEVKRVIDEGVIGEPKRVVITQHQPVPPQPWVLRHGIANELLIHGLDLASWYLGAEPVRLHVTNEVRRATVHVGYASGQDAVVTGSWVDGFPSLGGANDTVLQVVGDRGHVIACRPATLLVNTDRAPRHVVLPPSTYAEPFAHEWAAFLRWIEGGEPGELAVGVDALRVHRTLQEIDAGRTVREDAL